MHTTVCYSDFVGGKNVAPAVVCCYHELQKMRKKPSSNFPPGSLFTYLDQQHQSFFNT